MSILQDSFFSKHLLRTCHVLDILFLRGLIDELSLVEEMNKPAIVIQFDKSQRRGMHRENSPNRRSNSL